MYSAKLFISKPEGSFIS